MQTGLAEKANQRTKRVFLERQTATLSFSPDPDPGQRPDGSVLETLNSLASAVDVTLRTEHWTTAAEPTTNLGIVVWAVDLSHDFLSTCRKRLGVAVVRERMSRDNIRPAGCNMPRDTT